MNGLTIQLGAHVPAALTAADCYRPLGGLRDSAVSLQRLNTRSQFINSDFWLRSQIEMFSKPEISNNSIPG